MDSIKFISLFSGAMGLDLGLEIEGFNPSICVENNEEAINTIRLNRPNLPILNDIYTVSAQQLRSISLIEGDIPLVVGGPPCQSFSVFGKRDGIESTNGKLLFEFFRIIDELRPQTFIMENVRGLLSMPVIPKKNNKNGQDINSEYYSKGSLLKLLFNKFNDIGYHIDCFIVNAVNYGAPQIRERIICIGNRFGLDANFPLPEFSNRIEDNLPPFKTLGEVIGQGFVDHCPEVLNFSPRKLKYLAMIPPGGNWRSLPLEIQQESMGKSWYLKGGRSAYWRKLSFAFPSPTVVTLPNHAGTSMCHPSELRAISVGEAAAIQEFPQTWKFSGNTTAKFRQIGNAVPIRLGIVSGKTVKDLLFRINQGERDTTQSVEGYRIIHLRPHVRTRSYWKNGKALAGDISYYENNQQINLFELENNVYERS
ncbi:DNA cytosine methyltransferase [Herpetosiphon geysericola]|uniref:DNA (cytosine-5-)-methyltransferase n=1 Tax=Herpetosiphon geysericola TaxID=70996 RepID=A0A0N8GR98_9CHLR|nr:DNA (cytosine-5-)-methyltransferase [Herpetosiphon geysericola]KPL85898.1 restriction endonuclease SinI [Herpetosiphon geysericola]